MKFVPLILAALLFSPGIALAESSHHAGSGTAVPSGTVAQGQGKVNSVDAKAGKINLTHGPIEALKWPAMTMDFAVLPGTNLAGVKPGDAVNFTLGRAPDGMYAINGIQK